jgi:hypothetical protein
VKNAEECLREAEECDRLVDLANTHGARTLLMVAAFQWRKLALPTGVACELDRRR